MEKQTATEYYAEKLRQESVEHRDALLSIASILQTKEGEKLFKYLFKNFEVANLPPKGMEDKELHEYLGYLRAGNSVYKLVCEADANIAASILSKLERERYDHKLEEYRIEQEYANSNTDS